MTSEKIAEMREAFEAWTKAHPANWSLDVVHFGGVFHHYMYPDTDTAWMGFSAAYTSLASELQQRREREGELRQIISNCAAALPSGAFVSPTASIEFMRNLPDEIRLVCARLASPTSPTEVKALEAEVDRIWAQLTKFVYARGEVAVGRSAYNDEKSAKDIIRSALQEVRDE